MSYTVNLSQKLTGGNIIWFYAFPACNMKHACTLTPQHVHSTCWTLSVFNNSMEHVYVYAGNIFTVFIISSLVSIMLLVTQSKFWYQNYMHMYVLVHKFDG